MKKYLIAFFLCLYLIPGIVLGKGLDAEQNKIKKPPRIIRTCCAFGSDIGIVGVPFLKYTEVTSIELMGDHKYLGDKDERNGIVYTCEGGFIDIGHLRDQADWTAFLYHLITENRGEEVKLKLGLEGGVKRLVLDIPDTISSNDAILLAGRITYDLSVWHEISTWFGVSSVPFVPERYSAFSLEDDYSNLLGVTLGMKAIQSNLPFEKAMTQILANTLDTLHVVSSEEETLAAMEKVHNEWWTREKRLPSRKIIMMREISTYTGSEPLLVPDMGAVYTPHYLKLPLLTSANKPLTSFYKLDFKLNRKFPYHKMFPENKGRKISQDDFNVILNRVTEEVNRKQAAENLREMEKQNMKTKNKG